MKKPCTAWKSLKSVLNRQSLVRSPLNCFYDNYTNYWNLHQVFFFQGTCRSIDIQNFILGANIRNPSLKVNFKFIPHNHMGSMRVVSKIKCLVNRSSRVETQLSYINHPQISMALMALLSSGKVHIFDDYFLILIQHLVNSCYNKDDNLVQSRVLADKASFILDYITANEPLNFQKNMEINYVEIFEKYMKNPDLDHDFQLSTENINFLPQRRLLVTPTLLIFLPTVIDESNRVLRKFKDYLSSFVRVSFVNDQFEKNYYSNESARMLLGYIHSIIQRGIRFTNQQLDFLSYSNSQIKSHQCWMLAYNVIPSCKVP